MNNSFTKQTAEGIYIHDRAEAMPQLPLGRFVHMPKDGCIFGLACPFPASDQSGRVYVSHDEGQSWEAMQPFSTDASIHATDSGAFIATRAGTLVAGFGNLAEKKNWNWDEQLKDSPGAELPTYVARSLDGGKSWVDVQKLHSEWTGANRDLIQTRSGALVLSSMKLLNHPGRHTVLTYRSDDEGKSWTPSNILDLGGNGHHDGVTEACLLELRDGRLLMYIRTNWGYLWRAISTDDGRTWHPYGPTCHPASSTPPFLLRLASGRVLLLWNRALPEGEASYPLMGGDGIWSATPASNFRHELSLCFSEDDCATWSTPHVIARNPKGEVCYPYAFEVKPGHLWISAHRFGLRMALREADFIA